VKKRNKKLEIRNLKLTTHKNFQFPVSGFYFLILFFTLIGYSQQIEYKLIIENPHRNYFNVEINYDVTDEKYVDFVMPVWTPGSYIIKDWAKNVIDVQAQNETRETLKFYKTDKQTWRVESVNSQKILFSYKVYAYTTGNPYHAHIEKDFAFFNGALLFMYVNGKKELPCNLTFVYPNNWEIHTSLQDEFGKDYYGAQNYDEFIDCPAFLGKIEKFSFVAAGKTHYVVMNAGYEYNQSQITNDLTKMIEWFAGLFGELPYKHYTFFLRVSDPGSGGIEHLYSNISGMTPKSLSGDIEDNAYYSDFLMLESHEYFHLWNVKRLRPTVLGPFDYTKEAYTDMLWVCEGLTSYYTHRPLSKAGILDEEKIFKSWTWYYNGLLNNSALYVKSVSQYSYDAWLRSDIPDYTFRVYYRKGAFIGMLLDIDMRLQTDQNKTMDGFFRYFYEKVYKRNETYDMDSFLYLLNQYSGIDYTAFFNKYVTGLEKLPMEDYFNKIGLEIKPDNGVPFLGIKVEPGFRASVAVSFVYPDSPADKLRIGRGDNIVSINDEAVTIENWNSLITNLKVGEAISIKWFHNEKLESERILIDKKQLTSAIIQRKDSITEKEKEFLKKWLLP